MVRGKNGSEQGSEARHGRLYAVGARGELDKIRSRIDNMTIWGGGFAPQIGGSFWVRTVSMRLKLSGMQSLSADKAATKAFMCMTAPSRTYPPLPEYSTREKYHISVTQRQQHAFDPFHQFFKLRPLTNRQPKVTESGTVQPEHQKDREML